MRKLNVYLKCEDCNFETTSENDLRNHIDDMVHNIYGNEDRAAGILLYEACHTCGKICQTKEVLMIHRYKDHNDLVKLC